MGGVINIACRFKDGRTVCQERWTNNFPYYLRHQKAYEGDVEHLENYFFGMLRNNDYVADPSHMGTPQAVKNSEYGLLVFDFVTNHILDNNGYSSVDSLDPIKFSIDREYFDEHAQTGRLQFETIEFSRNPFTKIRETISEKLSYDEAVKMAEFARAEERKRWDRPLLTGDDGKILLDANKQPIRAPNPPESPTDFHYDFKIDTSPMTVINYPHRSFTDFKAKLIELGFPLTKAAANTAWKPKMRRGNVSDEEIAARAFFEHWKSYSGDKGKEYDGRQYDSLTDDQRTKLLEQGVFLIKYQPKNWPIEEFDF